MHMPILSHMIKRQSAIIEMQADEFLDIALFKERAEKLFTSQQKYQTLPISKTSRNPVSGVTIFEANTPDIDEVTNIALKFRFFYANKEPTQFQKILNKVRRRTSDNWACGYLDLIAIKYKEAMKRSQVSGSLGKAVPNKEIIDLWFNSEFFHSDPSKKQKLSEIHAIIGNKPSLFQLYTAIANCSARIRDLYLVVHKLDDQHRFIYTPNHDFQAAARTNLAIKSGAGGSL